MPINTQIPDWLVRQLPDQQSNAQLNQQVSANLLHGMQNKQKQRDQAQQDRQLSQRDKQINIQERDQLLQEKLAPIQFQSFQNKLKLQSIEIADALRQEQEEVEAREAASLLNSHVKRSLKGGIGAEDATLAQAYDILSRYPTAAKHPAVKTSLLELQTARSLKAAKEKLGSEQDFEAQMLGAKQEGMTERRIMQDESDLELQQLRNEGRATGKAPAMRRTIMPDGSVVEEPMTGNTTLSPSTRAQFQQKMNALQNLQGTVRDLSKNLRPGAVGPIAAAREAVSQYSGNVPGANLADVLVGIGGKDFEQRQKLKELRAIAFRAFSDQTGQVSDRDQKMIDDLIPSTGFKGNTRLARQSLESLAENSARRALSYGSDLGNVPDWAIQNADARDLTSMVEDKILKLEVLTPEQLKTLVGRNQAFLPLAREELKRRQSLQAVP